MKIDLYAYEKYEKRESSWNQNIELTVFLEEKADGNFSLKFIIDKPAAKYIFLPMLSLRNCKAGNWTFMSWKHDEKTYKSTRKRVFSI